MGPCVSAWQGPVGILGVCRVGVQPWLWQTPLVLSVRPLAFPGSPAFYLLGPCPLLWKHEELGVLRFPPAGPREERSLGCLCLPRTQR